MPFANPKELGIHFRKHGHEVGARTAAEYEQMADAFMLGAMNTDTQECLRGNRVKRCRLDFVTTHFGVALAATPVMLTFYPPRPDTIARYGGILGYFQHECGRMD